MLFTPILADKADAERMLDKTQCYIACVELLPVLISKQKVADVKFTRIRGDRRRFAERKLREKEWVRATDAVADLRENMQALRACVTTGGY